MRIVAIIASQCLLACCLLSVQADEPQPKPNPQNQPKKIVLIAGAKDKNHPQGTHEYEKSVRLLKLCLDTSPNVKGVKVEAHFNGWPQDPKTLDDADTIVLISSGADRNEQDHPLLVGDRLATIERQMARGCGLVLIHWTTFLPNEKAGDKALEWIGGYFDYQSGPPPRRWLSAIQDLTALLTPAEGHAICQGVRPFKLREELYYRIRFRDSDDRLRPVLSAELPGEVEKQTVAWAVERKDGGRGFGFTGGHYFDNWTSPDFRKLVLNAIVWTARADVPTSGVESELPTAEQLEEPVGDPDWTPPPKEGKSAAWERETDKDWVDGRLASMDTGPFFNATFQYPSFGATARSFKGTAIRIGGKEQGGVIFDRNQLRLAAAWQGSFLKHSSTRFGLLNTPAPDGTVEFATRSGPGWAGPDGKWDNPHPATAPLPREWAHYRGLYLHDDRVVLAYTVGGTEVLDSPGLEGSGGLTAYTRTLEIAAADQSQRMLVCELELDDGREAQPVSANLCVGRRGDVVSAVALVGGAGDASLQIVDKSRVEVPITAHQEPVALKLLMWRGSAAELPKLLELLKNSPPPEPLAPLCRPGPTRWGEPLKVQATVAENDAAYVIDTLGVPFDNRFKALMFTSGVDFLPNGDLAVSTAHGDVWLVHGADSKLDQLTWRRFATSLYQPLGLKVLDGKIYVLERGQLTRLHDTNGDGEADFYENINSDWHTGPGEHSFDTCLETDPQGNFYFFKTGDPETPSGGGLIRVSADGKSHEVFATGFRHPIGMSVSPTGIVTGADQQGNWMPATRIDQYRQGGFYGDMRTHHRSTPPTIYDGPLCWLPHEVDNSAGGQVWVPAGRFGPLSGQLLHLSYGRCKLMLLMRQQVGEQAQGAATDLHLSFLSGVMRGRFNPHDGHLYLVGMDGWQTAAVQDGCLQRVRYTGQPVAMPIGLSVHADGIRLQFTEELDRERAEDAGRYRIRQWNYLWSAEYGSKRYSVAHPEQVGEDDVAVRSARLLDDRRSVLLEVADLKPVMQMEISYNLRTAAGQKLSGLVYNTVHEVGEDSGTRQ